MPKHREWYIVFCHCAYEGCYVLNKIKVLISSSGFSDFFFQVFFELHWVLPYHALNSEFANFETPCMSVLSQITYGNMALIVLSYFHGYKKKKHLQIIGIIQMFLNIAAFSVTKRSISSAKKKIDFLNIFT
jgi:hypothetical protein